MLLGDRERAAAPPAPERGAGSRIALELGQRAGARGRVAGRGFQLAVKDPARSAEPAGQGVPAHCFVLVADEHLGLTARPDRAEEVAARTARAPWIPPGVGAELRALGDRARAAHQLRPLALELGQAARGLFAERHLAAVPHAGRLKMRLADPVDPRVDLVRGADERVILLLVGARRAVRIPLAPRAIPPGRDQVGVAGALEVHAGRHAALLGARRAVHALRLVAELERFRRGQRILSARRPPLEVLARGPRPRDPADLDVVPDGAHRVGGLIARGDVAREGRGERFAPFAGRAGADERAQQRVARHQAPPRSRSEVHRPSPTTTESSRRRSTSSAARVKRWWRSLSGPDGVGSPDG